VSWVCKIDKRAVKDLKMLDIETRKQIITFIEHRLIQGGNPRNSGKALKGKFEGLWRYRSGNYRILCQIQDDKLTVLVVKVSHRKKVYF